MGVVDKTHYWRGDNPTDLFPYLPRPFLMTSSVWENEHVSLSSQECAPGAFLQIWINFKGNMDR